MAEAYMVKITVGNNVQRSTVIVPSTQTLRKTLEDAGIDYTRGMTTLDGSTLGAGELDKSFGDMGIKEKAFLLNVVKADNAILA